MTGIYDAAAAILANSSIYNSVNYFLSLDSRGDDLMTFINSMGNIGDSSARLGKLAYKEEPGKVRVFAIVDVITQWVLKPLHNYIFNILRGLHQVDATFNQEKGISILQEKIQENPNSEV